MSTKLTRTFITYLNHYSGLTPECWRVLLICLFETIALGFAFYISIYLVSVLHFNTVSAGLVISFYGAGTILGGFLGGKIADTISSGFVVRLSLVGESFLLFFLPFLHSLNLLIIDACLLGIFAYMFKTASTLQIISANSKLSSSTRLKAINMEYTFSNAGLGISATLISIFSNSGIQYLFFAAGGLTIVLAFIHFAYCRDHYYQPVVDASNKAPSSKTKKSFAVFLAILASLFIVGIIISQNRTIFPIYISSVFPQYGMRGVSLLYVINPVLIIFYQTPLINKLKHLNKLDISGFGAAIMGLGSLMLLLTSSFLWAVIASIVYTIGEMLFFSVSQFLAYEASANRKKGRALGLYQMTYATSVVLGPTLGGLIYHHVSSTAVWYLCGLIGLFALFWCLTLRNRAKAY